MVVHSAPRLRTNSSPWWNELRSSVMAKLYTGSGWPLTAFHTKSVRPMPMYNLCVDCKLAHKRRSAVLSLAAAALFTQSCSNCGLLIWLVWCFGNMRSVFISWRHNCQKRNSTPYVRVSKQLSGFSGPVLTRIKRVQILPTEC